MCIPATRQLLLLPLLVSLAACGNSNSEGTSAAEPANTAGQLKRHEAAQVRVLPAIRQEMQRALETTTVVESERNVIIQPISSGLVVELLAEEGDHVKKGQTLARLDQRDTQAQLDDAKIGLKEAEEAASKGEISKRDAEGKIAKARLSFEQAKSDFTRNDEAKMISALEIENLKLAMDTAAQDLDATILARDSSEIDIRTQATAILRAKLAIERARVAHQQMELIAPFDGVLTDRGIQVGDNVSSAVEAFTITDLSDLRTVFYRPQRELSLFTGIGPGASDGAALGFQAIEVTAESEALPGITFTGRIERISPNIDATSGSFRVTVRLDEESEGMRLLPGMLLRLRLVTERHLNALTVSKRALRREGDAAILFVAENNLARRVELTEGFSGNEYVEVFPKNGAALEAGMDIIVVGNRELEDGKDIEISPWDDQITDATEETTDEESR
ncbi:MAG: membrane fusion protein (multidrug efflux system) [Planctomycetota bacterium]|jgi:membrane fusion protein (multidrug efflux system)